MLVDSHVHIFPPQAGSDRERYRLDPAFGTLYASPSAKTAVAGDLIAAMDRAGIDISVIVNIGWNDPGLCRETNDYLLDAAAQHPGRLVAFCGVNPASGAEAVREAQRCAAKGARGIGELHPDYQGYSLADAGVMAPLMEAADALGLVLLTHASEPVGHEYFGKGNVTPDVLYKFVLAFPRSPVILAHWGGGLPFYALMPEVRKALANAYFDSAASPFLYEASIFDRVPSIVGADHVLFASDFPLLRPERLLKQVAQSALPPPARDLVLGGNAARLLKLGASGA